MAVPFLLTFFWLDVKIHIVYKKQEKNKKKISSIFNTYNGA